MKHSPSPFLSAILTVLLIALPCIPLAGCGASDVDRVISDLPIAVDIATSVISIVSPGDASLAGEVTEYSGKVSADLKLASALLKQFQSDLSKAPPETIARVNSLLADVQTNLSAILNAVGVKNPTVTAAVAAAVGSVRLILNDVGLLVKNNAPPAVSAQLFFGVGMPGVDFMAVLPGDKAATQSAYKVEGKGSGKNCRRIAQEYNQKISKDFPAAKVNVPRAKLLGVPVPFTGGK